MQINLDTDVSQYRIVAYAEGEVTVVIPRRFDARPVADDELLQFQTGVARRETLHRSLIIMPERLVTDWPPRSPEDLEAAHFEELAAHPGLEVVLFGSGARLHRPGPRILAPLTDRGIGVEVMDTGSACRTYNFLMADRRNVAAALLMI
jgi:uncharacterized protein